MVIRAVDLSINALAERVGDFLYEKGTLLYRFHAGLSSELPLSKLHGGFPQLTEPREFRAGARDAAQPPH